MEKIFTEENGNFMIDCSNALWATDKLYELYHAAKCSLSDVDWILHYFTTFSKKNNVQDNFRVIISLPKYITKESDPIRQAYYTTKRTRLVDFFNIFIFILKPVPRLQLKRCSCLFYPCW